MRDSEDRFALHNDRQLALRTPSPPPASTLSCLNDVTRCTVNLLLTITHTFWVQTYLLPLPVSTHPLSSEFYFTGNLFEELQIYRKGSWDKVTEGHRVPVTVDVLVIDVCSLICFIQ